MENKIDWELYDNTPYKYDKIKMLKAWAEKGDAEAQCKLGDKYYYGVGVSINYLEAFRLYSLSAEQGNMLAQFYLGVMFEHGWGVKQNYKEAFNWYMKSALQGDEMSQNNLGHLYDYGLGLPVEYHCSSSISPHNAPMFPCSTTLSIGHHPSPLNGQSALHS